MIRLMPKPSFGWSLVLAALGLGALAGGPAAAASIDRAAAVARTLERAPELAARRAALADVTRLERAAGAYPNNPRLELEAAGEGPGPFGSGSRSIRAAIRQELDTHDVRGARGALARAESSRLRAAAGEIELDLARHAEAAFGVLLVADRRAALAESIAATSARVVAVARRAQRLDVLSPYGLRQLELDDARARERAALARAQRAEAATDLAALFLAGPEESFEPVDDLDGAPWACASESLAALAADRRPDIRAARAEADLADAETHLAAREGRAGPEIELFVERSRDRVDADAFGGDFAGVPGFNGFEDRGTVVGAGVSLPLPFFQRNEWPAGRSRINALRAQAAWSRLRAGVPLEVAAACNRVRAAQERATILGAALSEAIPDRGRIERAYREGRLDLDAYLAQRGRLVDAAAEQVEALAAIEQARSELARVTGLTHAELAAALGGTPQGDSR